MAVFGIIEEAWALRNHNRAAARAASEAVVASPGADRRVLATAKVVLAYLDYRERRYEQAAAASLEAAAVLETNPNDPWLPRLYNTLAIIHLDLGERDLSRTYLDRQIRLSHALGDHTYEAIGYHDLGLLQAAVDSHRGLRTLEQSCAMFHASTDTENEALALYNMANIAQHDGERALAIGYADRALELLRITGTQGMAGYLTIHLATLKAETIAALGRYREAERLLGAAHALAAADFPELLPHVQFCQGLLLVAIGDDASAVRQFENALAQIDAAGPAELRADCHAALADCYERQGDYRAALHHHRTYASTRERTFLEISEQKVRALDVIHQVESARQAAVAERQRNTELQQYVRELEQLQSTLRAISVRDPLTGLHNRRYLAEEGGRMLRYAQRYQTTLCAAMIDVDGFKAINDTLGHHIGDLVLQRLAEMITHTMRSTDLISRYGGEEIALLLPSTSLDDAFHLCERLRLTVEHHDWSNVDARLRVTISIGLATGHDCTLTELLAGADARLYLAKRAGRNQTRYE